MNDISSTTLDAIHLNLQQMQSAADYVQSIPDCRKTPVLLGFQHCLDSAQLKNSQINLKLECMQTTGSFKYRGVIHQMHMAEQTLKPGQQLITWSGGNYGRAFATVTQKLGLPALVLMPKTVPPDRATLIRNLGAQVELHDSAVLPDKIEEYIKKGYRYFHPFDDIELIKGYSSVAYELLDQVGVPDILLVNIGGGGLIAGVATTFRLLGHDKMKIYGIEPVTASTMFQSFQQGRTVPMPNAHSVATGLCPPRAGEITYQLCKKYIDDVLLVSDHEILDATKVLFELGMRVEPSGAAGMAALLTDKVPGGVAGKKVVVVVSGGNITFESLSDLFKN